MAGSRVARGIFLQADQVSETAMAFAGAAPECAEVRMQDERVVAGRAAVGRQVAGRAGASGFVLARGKVDAELAELCIPEEGAHPP
ncbi:MAG: hypothetical protein R3C04_07350 [Hyphomonas sp.]